MSLMTGRSKFTFEVTFNFIVISIQNSLQQKAFGVGCNLVQGVTLYKIGVRMSIHVTKN